MIRNKIDLHLHLDGSVSPKTVYELSRKEGFAPECNLSLEEIAREMVIQPGTFDPDYKTFDPPIRAMQSAYGLQRITEELVDRLVADGLCYAEIRFAPQFHLEKGLSQREVVEAVLQGLKKAEGKLPLGLILCAMDQGKAEMNRKANWETLELAKEYLGKGVVGFDVAGYETDLSSFAELFEEAKRLGVPSTCHSEFTVQEAFLFPISRIGHGYQCAESEDLMEKTVERGITLEMCPVSSVKYDYGLQIDESHPLRQLFLKGAKVTINTDNLTVLDTSLDKEYEMARKMGFTDEEIEACNRNAILASFAPETVKRTLLSLTD